MRYYNPRKDFTFFGLMLQSSQKISSFFNSYAFFAFFSLFFTFTCSVEDDYLYHFCSNSTNLAGNSAFIANVDRFLSSLSNATVDPNYGFYNATVGKTPNIVYGNFLCRGDVSAEICHDCVTAAAADDVAGRCRTGYEAVIWYEKCTIRYSNRSILAVMAIEPKKTLRILQNVSEPDRLNGLVAVAVKEISARAADAPIGDKKFATKEVKFNEFQNIYSLAQCTPDISGADCRRCLEFAIGDLPGCCSGKEGGLVFYPSCNLWYQLTPFYDQNETSTPPPAPPPVPPVYPPFLVNSGKRRISSSILVGIIVSIVCFVLISGFLYWKLIWKSRKKNRPQMEQNVGTKTGDQRLQFELSIIRTATDNFADVNVVGKGGFGTVYKGVFANGQEIAVKRLSRSSTGQGPEEFKNEVVLVAHLQHRNLVKLLGYCAEGNERMLIFEFVPNRSLDYYLFDPQRRGELDWPKRLKIIKGIARGLLYLHTDSRVKIIHRDVKASNILLDEDMTPKITDFGMARIIEENQTQEPTQRVVGTYGYISPEFATRGKYSEKSDVFSFGVLMLELVCGEKNTGFCNSNSENLLTYAWKHWKDGTVLELMDPTLRDSSVSGEVTRCVQIGLLCVQEKPTARPTMGRVVLMLSSSSVTVPAPQKTAFFFGSTTGISWGGSSNRGPDRNANISNSFSVDDASITRLHPR